MTATSHAEQMAPLIARRDWHAVRANLREADDNADGATLEPAALTILAEACWWLGLVNEALDARRRAFEIHEAADRPVQAAGIALLMSEDHRRQGRGSVAQGWRRRAAAPPPVAAAQMLAHHALSGIPSSRRTSPRVVGWPLALKLPFDGVDKEQTNPWIAGKRIS